MRLWKLKILCIQGFILGPVWWGTDFFNRALYFSTFWRTWLNGCRAALTWIVSQNVPSAFNLGFLIFKSAVQHSRPAQKNPKHNLPVPRQLFARINSTSWIKIRLLFTWNSACLVTPNHTLRQVRRKRHLY